MPEKVKEKEKKAFVDYEAPRHLKLRPLFAVRGLRTSWLDKLH